MTYRSMGIPAHENRRLAVSFICRVSTSQRIVILSAGRWFVRPQSKDPGLICGPTTGVKPAHTEVEHQEPGSFDYTAHNHRRSAQDDALVYTTRASQTHGVR
jgi:hypothetical protein